MLDSGLTFTLHKGSYTHFYSEQWHRVRNASAVNPAEVFIVRFYQSGKENSRQVLRRELWAFLSGRARPVVWQSRGSSQPRRIVRYRDPWRPRSLARSSTDWVWHSCCDGAGHRLPMPGSASPKNTTSAYGQPPSGWNASS